MAGDDRAAGGHRRLPQRGAPQRGPARVGRARGPGADLQAESAEALHGVWEVRRAVTELPAEEQEVVRMQHFEGLTHTQIAERLELPAGTVKSRSFRAHKRLAALLADLRE